MIVKRLTKEKVESARPPTRTRGEMLAHHIADVKPWREREVVYEAIWLMSRVRGSAWGTFSKLFARRLTDMRRVECVESRGMDGVGWRWWHRVARPNARHSEAKEGHVMSLGCGGECGAIGPVVHAGSRYSQ
jgi:hypothetical protein